MEIILKTDIAGLGYKNDVVNVKPGYGRNYLIPQGFAVQATGSNKKVLAENIKQVAHKAEKVKLDALALAEAIGDVTLAIAAKVGESGKIFGRVTTIQISESLKEKGFDVDRRKIVFDDIKNIGTYEANINLFKDINATITLDVIAE